MKEKPETKCEKFEHRLHPLSSPMKFLKADQIYQMMMRVRSGLCMTANPASFTNKIVPTPDPQVQLRQNESNELELICPLPIAKINVRNPSLVDEIHNIITIFMHVLPQNDIAFPDETVKQRAMSKRYRTLPEDEEVNKEDFEFEIVPLEIMPKSDFAKVPMQLGKWFPGMFSVFPND